jgi:nucleoside-diphosphate kinase
MSVRDEYNERYAFDVDWFDHSAGLVRKYQLVYYPKDSQIEMFDVKNRRTFLKKCEYPSITVKDLFIGATVSIYSRQLKVVAYSDQFTANKLQPRQEKTLAILKPDGYAHLGKIMDAIVAAGMQCAEMRMTKLTGDEVEEFYEELRGTQNFGRMVSFMSSDAITCMTIVGDGSVRKWIDLMGPMDPNNAKRDAPQSLRAIFGSDLVQNVCHGSADAEAAQREIDFFFGPNSKRFAQTAVLDNCTLAIVKPHALAQGLGGQILDDILQRGFEISALQIFREDRANIEEFLEVYKDVVPEYNDMVAQLLEGPLLAMEIRAEDAVASFREFVGPADPAIGRTLRPHTLRAKYGHDKVRNALHCTDLPEDGGLDVEYFFRILVAQKHT